MDTNTQNEGVESTLPGDNEVTTTSESQAEIIIDLNDPAHPDHPEHHKHTSARHAALHTRSVVGHVKPRHGGLNL